MKRWRALVLMVLGAAAAGWIGCRMNHAPSSGPMGGRLAPCPASPNCVCSQDADPAHQIEPLTFTGSGDKALRRVRELILAEPRTRLIRDEPGYLQAEFRSRIFRFVDDVEFLLDEPAGRIHLRSASRVGHSDLGVNRRRLENLRRAFSAASAGTAP